MAPIEGLGANPGELGTTLDESRFALDDYEQVNSRYFDTILRTKSWAALPAGWHNPSSAGVAGFTARSLSIDDLQRYALDEGHALGDLKENLLQLASGWESNQIRWEELTLCPSVSSANLVVLSVLKAYGVEKIIFETPAYYGTLEQARLLGFRVCRIPCVRASAFRAPLDLFIAATQTDGRSAIWLTQPRFGIGTNQNPDSLRSLAAAVDPSVVIIIDEAAEQTYPSILSTLGPLPCDLIRTRGILKGAGLNGLRLSMILHPRHWRSQIESTLETAGASLDRFSLVNAAGLIETPGLLASMLSAANMQVCRLQRRLSALTVGSWAEPTPLENGYIGSILLDFRRLPGSYEEKRAAFLEHCQSIRLPVVLRASIGFPHDPDWEAIRINYFTPDENIDQTGHLIVDAFQAVYHRLKYRLS